MSANLNRDKALIFRIVHGKNVPWIVANGMHCRHSDIQDPGYVGIGNPELIDKRQDRPVPIAPNGTLSDYIPFYFTPYTPMMLNIKTGWGGIKQVPNEDVVIFVSSLRKIDEQGQSYVFTDRHAYLFHADFYNSLDDLGVIDWKILQQRDFKRDTEDPEKLERYQAEALIHARCPLSSFLGIVCHSEKVRASVASCVGSQCQDLKIISQPNWYL